MWEDTVQLLKWLKSAKPEEVYEEAQQCSNTHAAFNMCDHLITEVERREPLNIHARILKARLFLKTGAKSDAVDELYKALLFAKRADLSAADDPEIAAGAELLAELSPPREQWTPPPMPSDLAGVLSAMHELCEDDDFNPACTDEQIEQLQSYFANDLPPEAVQIYRDHNGSANLPLVRDEEISIAAAIVSVEYLSKTQDWLAKAFVDDNICLNERIAWIWFDGAGNYAGVFLDGPHKGKITKYFHEVPEIRPSYESIYDFMSIVLRCGYMPEEEDDRPCDIYMLPEGLIEQPA